MRPVAARSTDLRETSAFAGRGDLRVAALPVVGAHELEAGRTPGLSLGSAPVERAALHAGLAGTASPAFEFHSAQLDARTSAR